MAGLARDPEKRPTAEQFAKMLAQTDDRVAPPIEPRPRVPRAPVSPKLKLLAGALAAVAIAVLAIALSGRSSGNAASPLDRSPVSASPEEATPTEQPSDEQTPMVVDQYGNPVDEETAKAILDQMQRDAEEQLNHPGKGRKKKKYRGE
jgi:hypothetical protein